MQQQKLNNDKWGPGHRRSQDDVIPVKDTDENSCMFSPQVASALGYGGRCGAAFKWWIPLVCLPVAIGGYILWVLMLFRAYDDTGKGLKELRLRTFGAWEALRWLLIALAIIYPVLIAAAAIVSIWRGVLVAQMGRGSSPLGGPGRGLVRRWRRRCVAWQWGSGVTTTLLWLLVLLLLLGFAGLCAWAAFTAGASEGGRIAIDLAGPTWNGVINIVNQATFVVENFLYALNALPAIGHRHLLSDTLAAGPLAHSTPAGSSHQVDTLVPSQHPHNSGQGGMGLPAAMWAAGVAAHRALQQQQQTAGQRVAEQLQQRATAPQQQPRAAAQQQTTEQASEPAQEQESERVQLPSLQEILVALGKRAGQAVNTLDTTSTAAATTVAGLSAAVNASGINNLLPELLPAGSDMPLVGAITNLTALVGRQVFNATGCPVYCLDLRSLSVIEDGCLCNMDRLKASLPWFSRATRHLIPAILGKVAMFAAATWLLMHASAMWARARLEGKLLREGGGPSTAAAAAAAAAAAGGPGSHPVGTYAAG